MGYKKELMRRVSDLLTQRKYGYRQNLLGDVTPSGVPDFALIDSPKDGYFGVLLSKYDSSYFIRKAWQYGLIFDSEPLLRSVGGFENVRIFNVHIVEPNDEKQQTKNKK